MQRLLKQRGNSKCVVTDKPQTADKEARTLASSVWVQKHTFMPPTGSTAGWSSTTS